MNRTKERIVYINYQACQSKKDEVIFSANKSLGKLVNVYVILLIENKIRKQETKGGKAYYSYHYSSDYYLK